MQSTHTTNKKQTIFAMGILLAINLVILLIAWSMRQVVVDSWKKGPLIDPAAPYAPENAQWYFAISMCCVLNGYFLLLSWWSGRWSRRWYVPMLALGTAILVTESGLQLYLQRYQTTYFRPHPTLHWTCRANLHNFTNTTGGGSLNTNAHGMREVTVDYEKSPNEFRIMVLGDSSNFGHGVAGQEMWSSQLQEILDSVSEKKITVLNAACPGWTTWQAVEVMESYGILYQPDIIIAGFNNDPGPDFFTDRERVSPSPLVRNIQSVLFRSELFVISREALLSWVRKLLPTSQQAYAQRLAGEKSNYGQLPTQETLELVSRVPLQEFTANIAMLDTIAQQHQAKFVWLNMPINRREGDLVERYVNWEYRQTIQDLASTASWQLIDVDGFWQRSRERDLHIVGHVFHPNATGHRRMAEQIAMELVEKQLVPDVTKANSLAIHTLPLATHPQTLRFGWSSKTPMHAHIGTVFAEHPAIFTQHNLDVELFSYDSGKTQGDDVAKNKLDAWFSCAVPAIHMLDSRPDAKIVASLGELGNIAVITRGDIAELSDLRGKKVAFTMGSTPHMVWRNAWLSVAKVVTEVDIATNDLEHALENGDVDAIVTWDPWATEWSNAHTDWHVIAQTPFYSVLIVGENWAMGDTTHSRTHDLLESVSDALSIAQTDRDTLDAQVADIGDWALTTVQQVTDQNSNFQANHPISLQITSKVQEEIVNSARFVDKNRRVVAVFAPEWAVEK